MATNSIIYSIACAKSLEARALTDDRVRRLSEPVSAAEFEKVLAEMGYEGGNVGEMAENEIERTYAFLKKDSPDETATGAFLKEIDYHNAKVLAKAKYFKAANFRPILRGQGRIDPAALEDCVMSDNYASLPEPMRGALRELDSLYASGELLPARIDSELTRAMYADILAGLANSKYDELCGYFVARIDLANLSSALRSRNSDAKLQTIAGGTLSERTLESVAEATPEGIVEILRYSDYGQIARRGAEDLSEGHALVRFEREADDHLMAKFVRHRFETDSLMAFLGYFVGRLAEIGNVRILAAAGGDREKLKARLRKAYVE